MTGLRFSISSRASSSGCTTSPRSAAASALRTVREHERGRQHRDRRRQERQVRLRVDRLHHLAGDEGREAAADEPHEAVGRGRHGRSTGAIAHDRRGDQRVVDADEGAGEDTPTITTPGVVGEDADGSEVDRHQREVDVQRAGRAEAALQPRGDEHGEDRDEHAPAEEHRAELERASMPIRNGE